MDMNQLIYTRLSTDLELRQELARFYDAPAIFNTEFPADQAEGWMGKTQYPRIAYRYDMQADPQRSSSGTLHVSVYSGKDMTQCERIENMVRRALQNVVMKPEDGDPFCVSWARTDPFIIEGSNILLKDVSFDIVDFPVQITTIPDPAEAMNRFIGEIFSGVYRISYDAMEDIYEPAEQSPALYVRVVSSSKMQETYALVFVNVVLSIHVIAPTAEARMTWTRVIFNELFKRGEIAIYDGTEPHPFIIDGIEPSNTYSFLTTGQLTVRGMYTMLSHRIDRERENPLMHAYHTVEGG